MSELTIYHNARCSKSRDGLCELQQITPGAEVIEYLKQPFTEETLTQLIAKLGIKPVELVRTNEELFKSKYAGRKIYGKQWIKIMVKHPELIQRPIIVRGDKAIIGRPVESIIEFVKS